MLNRVAAAILPMVAILDAAVPLSAACGPSPEKGWVEFVDQAHGFCFRYPPTYKRETATSPDSSKDRQTIAALISNEPRKAFSDDKELATVRVCLLSGVFDLQTLVKDAPTGYDTPPTPSHYGGNLFYYYGAGGGVAYPDMYYFNLHGRALQLVFDGPYPGNDKSPNAKTEAVEKVILSSFKAAPRQ